MIKLIKSWFHKRKIYRAIGINSSMLKEGCKWGSSSIAFHMLESEKRINNFRNELIKHIKLKGVL